MKYKQWNSRHIASVAALILCCAFFSAVSVYADTADIPVYAEITAVAADLEITESVRMTSGETSTDLEFDAVTVTNNGNYGKDINITKIEVFPAEGWRIAAADTDFSNIHNQRIFSITTSEHDFVSGPCTEVLTAGPGESVSVPFAGKTGTFSQDICEQAAVITITVDTVEEAL